jgi:tetratricopeptide (TPR) repeat protein
MSDQFYIATPSYISYDTPRSIASGPNSYNIPPPESVDPDSAHHAGIQFEKTPFSTIDMDRHGENIGELVLPNTHLSFHQAVSFPSLAAGIPKSASDVLASSMGHSHRIPHLVQPDATYNLTDLRLFQATNPNGETTNFRAVRPLVYSDDNRHPDTLWVMHALANTYRDQGNYEESAALLHQVIDARKRVFGNDHPSTLRAMHDLAETYCDRGKYEESAALLHQVIDARKRVLSNDHPDTLRAMHTLANAYRDEGKYEESVALLHQVIDARKRVLGNDHPDTLRAMYGLAATCREQGTYQQSEALLQHVLERLKRVLGDDHLDTLEAINDLAATYRGQERYQQSEALLQQVLRGRKRVLGDDHPDTLRSTVTSIISTGSRRSGVSMLIIHLQHTGPLLSLVSSIPMYSSNSQRIQ